MGGKERKGARMKRLLCVLLGMALLLGCAPLGAAAQGGVTSQTLDTARFEGGTQSLPPLVASASPTPSQLAAQTPSQEDLDRAEQVTVTLDTQSMLEGAGLTPYGFRYPDTYCVLMDASTGQVLAEQNSHAQVAPASVTKVMTMLLLCEAMEAGEITEQDVVTASAYASSIGGSQIYLEEGEQMTVEDLMMSLALPSANDAAVCLGEYLCGSEAAFVERMNQRAQELGMENTHFVNPHGLDEEGHYSSAYDVALMTRRLLEMELGRKYVSTQRYVLREGTGRDWTMINSNPLLGTYDGCIGVKTGFTDAAHYCLSAAAQRDGSTFIAVCLGAVTTTSRNEECTGMLDYAFANYKTVTPQPITIPAQTLGVELGLYESVQTQPVTLNFTPMLVPAGTDPVVESGFTVQPGVTAPLEQSASVGEITVTLNGEAAFTQPITPAQPVERRSFWDAFGELWRRVFS